MSTPTPRPRVFVGSTSEQKFIARVIEKRLNEVADVDLWFSNVFEPGYSTLESLLKKAVSTDFAVLILTPDDMVESRGKLQWAPRDNIVFELGLFMSKLTPPRTFMLYPIGTDPPKIPSDLLGITAVPYHDRPGRLEEEVDVACFKIEKQIKSLGLNTDTRSSEILASRDQLGSSELGLRWGDLEARCKHELIIAGWSCRNVISGKTREVFKRLVERDCVVRFLVIHPDILTDTRFDMGPVCNIAHDHILKDVKTGIGLVEELKTTIDSRKRHRIELRGTKWFMAWSAVGVDTASSYGMIQVELYHYGNPYEIAEPLEKRVELILEPRSRFYQGFAKSLFNMWNAAEPISSAP